MASSVDMRTIQEKDFDRFVYVYRRLMEKYADQLQAISGLQPSNKETIKDKKQS